MPAAKHHTATTATNKACVAAQCADQHGRAHLQRHDDDQGHTSAGAVLQGDRPGDRGSRCRPHCGRPRIPSQRDRGDRQHPEQAAGHRADVRRGRPQGINDPTAGGHPPILTPRAATEAAHAPKSRRTRRDRDSGGVGATGLSIGSSEESNNDHERRPTPRSSAQLFRNLDIHTNVMFSPVKPVAAQRMTDFRLATTIREQSGGSDSTIDGPVRC